MSTRRAPQPASVREALENRYQAPAWALFFEMRNQTGWRKTTRSADAIAMSCYPSRGLELHGIEIKEHRSDWLRELKDPAKAEDFYKKVDRWWLVTPAGIVQPGELPPTWGHMEVRGERAKAVVEAPKLDPEPMDRAFLAAFLRHVHERYVPRSHVNAMIEKRVAEVREHDRQATAVPDTRALDHLKGVIASFEEKSGVRLNQYTLGDIAQAVRLVRAGEVDGQRRRLEELHGTALHIADRIKHALHGDDDQ